MHDLLYENQQTWTRNSDPTKTFVGYAGQLGLNTKQFSDDLKSEETNDIVRADLAEANKRGYASTPTFEINGKKIENPRDIESFQKVIDEAIKKAEGSQ